MSELEEIVITSDVSVYGKSSAWAAYIKTADDEHKIARTFKKRTKSAQGELYAPQKIREMHMWCDKASRKKCKEMNKELQRKGWYAGI